jgi:hypothetical protein
MYAYYSTNGVVVLFSRKENALDLPCIEVSDDIIKDNINRKMVAVVRNKSIEFIQDKAAVLAAVRQRRSVLLEEADSYRQKLLDNAIIEGIECNQSALLNIAIYRKALRDIVESEQIVWPERPW